jgi:hypothetical protein
MAYFARQLVGFEKKLVNDTQFQRELPEDVSKIRLLLPDG